MMFENKEKSPIDFTLFKVFKLCLKTKQKDMQKDAEIFI